MKAAIIIPVRWGSTRLPGKTLACVAGKTLIRRVWDLAKQVNNAEALWIATDDKRILNHCKEFTANVTITSSRCKNGTERVLEAVKRLKLRAQIIINLQGDAVLTPPWIIEALIEKMTKDKSCQIATPAYRLSPQELQKLKKAKAKSQTSGTTVVFNKSSRALYFSRSLIPSQPPIYAHIGLYAYTRKALEKFVSLPESPLEKTEGLEQLRALENGIPIDVVLINTRGRTLWAIDTPNDVAIAEKIISQEGEL